MAGEGAPASVKSAMRTLDILEFLVAQPRPMAAHELSVALDIPVSSLSYLLTTLVDRGYLDRTGRRYGPGPALGRLRPQERGRNLIERVTPVVQALRNQLNESVAFFIRRGYEVEALISEVGNHALRYSFEVGRHGPMHAVSAGKAILATLPPYELDCYFRESDRAAFTPTTLVTEAVLRADLEEIRRTGIAHTREELTVGIRGVGRAVIIDGEVVGGISLAVPIVRFDAKLERRSIELLIHATESLAGAGPAG